MFYHDPHLNVEAAQKADSIPGAAKELRGLADRVIPCGSPYTVVEKYLELEKLGYVKDTVSVTMVIIQGFILFFHSDIETTRQFIQNWEPKKKNKVPQNVLVKMIYKRFAELDSFAIHSNESVTKNKATGQAWFQNMVCVEIPEFRTISQFTQWAESFENKGLRLTYMGNDFPYWYRRFKKEILTKPELCDQDISMATDLLISHKVMAS